MADQVFDGYIRDEGASVIADCYFQVWFRSIEAGSAPSNWSDVRQAESDGYYNFSLGDPDLLDVGGVAQDQDEVVIVVWTGADTVRLGTNKTAFSFRVVELSGDTHTQDVTAFADDFPDTVASFPSQIPRLTDTTFVNSSEDDHAYANNHYQQPVYSGETIFDCCGILQVDVDWGDTEGDLLSGTNNGVHQYDDSPGTPVTVVATARDILGNDDTAPWTQGVTVVARTPSALVQVSNPTPQINDTIDVDAVSLVDLDSTVTSVDWSWDGGNTWPVQTRPVGEQQQLLITSTTDFTIVLRLNWYNGLSPLQLETDTQFINALPIASFTTDVQSVNASQHTFTYNGAGTITNYAWNLDYDPGGGFQDEADGSGAGMTQFVYNFDVAGDYRMRLSVTDADGDGHTAELLFSVTIGSAGGGISTRSQIHIPVGSKGLIR